MGVPLARLGIKKGLVSEIGEIDSAISRGIYKKEEQKESLGPTTCYNGNVDTLAFHIALMGLCFVGAKGLATLASMLPGSLGEVLSQFMFLHGLVIAYFIRWIMGKFNVLQYQNEILQARLTGTCTDMLIVSAFMAIQMSIVGKWILPILIVTTIIAIVTFFVSYYFGSRFGGTCDFERTLGLWGTATGTCPTGIALIRIVDPDLKTTAATEVGGMNVFSIPMTLGIYVALPTTAKLIAEGSSPWSAISIFIITGVVCLIILKVFRLWGKQTYSLFKK